MSRTRVRLIRALKRVGQTGRRLGVRPLARGGYAVAVRLSRAEADPLLLAHTVRHLGDVHQEAGRLALSEPCYQEALAIYRADPRTRPLDLANAVRPMALLQERLGNASAARALFLEARAMYADLGAPVPVAEMDAHLSGLPATTRL